jgi:hypothetical protein
MGKMIDTGEAANRLGVTWLRVQQLCRQRRIPGSRLIGRQWFVPYDFEVTPGARGPASQAKQLDMIPFEQAAAELVAAIAGEFPTDSELEWFKGVAINIDTRLHDDPSRPNKHARPVTLLFGSVAMRRYRIAGTAARKTRRADLRALVKRSLADYDAAANARKGQYVPRFVIACAEAIMD